MNNAFDHRASAVGGLALCAVVALWWLGSTRLALERAADAGRNAGDAVQVLLLLRGMMLAIVGPRLGALGGWRAAFGAGLVLTAASWPLVVLAWSASMLPLLPSLAAEAGLVAGCAGLPLAGLALRTLIKDRRIVDPVATALGVALAALCWQTRGHWLALVT